MPLQISFIIAQKQCSIGCSGNGMTCQVYNKWSSRMKSCAKSKSREYIEVMATVTTKYDDFLTFWFSGRLWSLLIHQLLAGCWWSRLNRPRNRRTHGPTAVWHQETTARGPIEHDFLRIRRVTRASAGSQAHQESNEGAGLEISHPKRTCCTLGCFGVVSQIQMDLEQFQRCCCTGFCLNLLLGCSSTSVGHQQALTIATKPEPWGKGLTWLKSFHQHPNGNPTIPLGVWKS